MRAISLFSGAGGFELGFQRAGIETVLQAESDPWCLSVLARHWPDTPRIHDVHQVDATALQGRSGDVPRAGRGPVAERLRHAAGRGGRAAGVDLIYGGFPCQDVSVAGNRAGLSGARSGLWHEFQRILSDLRPRWAVIENVPGLLSSNDGRDMATVLGGLGELGYGWAYRVLDARWFGVPQRRRRVFIVGCLGDAARAQAVLAVCESCGGDPAAGSEAGEGVAYALAASVRGTGDGHGNAWNSNYIPAGGPGLVRGLGTGAGGGVAATLSGGGHASGVNLPGRHKEDDENLVVGSEVDDGMARPLVARESGYRMDIESENFVLANTVRASDGHHGWSGGRGDGNDNLVVDEVADPITTTEGKTWTHEGNTFRTHNLIEADPIAFTRTESWGSGDGANVSPPTRSAGHGASNNPAVAYAAGVRRLTPLECERLMGWPDDHTRWGADGRELADAHRYRLCGNGVVAPVVEWLGHRLVEVDAWP